MSDNSAIEWTDSTWNPVRGCDKVSTGCKNCYAETFAERWRGIAGHPFEQGFDLRLVPEALDKPLRWKKPRRIFVNSMSDLFHEGVPFEYVDQIFGVMWACHHLGRGDAVCPGHVFQILTKRAELMAQYLSTDRSHAWARWAVHFGGAYDPDGLYDFVIGHARRGPHPRIHLGVSCEDQANADARIPLLLQCSAAVRFVSAEPLLGPIDGSRFIRARSIVDGYREVQRRFASGGVSPSHLSAPGIDWLIVGGESGPGARPCNIAWIRSIVEQGKASGTPVFVKQLGANVRDSDDAEFFSDVHPAAIASRAWPMPVRVEADPDGTRQCFKGAPVRVRLRDSKGGDPSEWPADLRVREFPRQADPT